MSGGIPHDDDTPKNLSGRAVREEVTEPLLTLDTPCRARTCPPCPVFCPCPGYHQLIAAAEQADLHTAHPRATTEQLANCGPKSAHEALQRKKKTPLSLGLSSDWGVVECYVTYPALRTMDDGDWCSPVALPGHQPITGLLAADLTNPLLLCRLSYGYLRLLWCTT